MSLLASAFGIPLTPLIGQQEETILCQISSFWLLLCVVTGCRMHLACLQSSVSPFKFILNSESPAVQRATFLLPRQQITKRHFHHSCWP